jgi:very-short-patch-repair endonuclease
MPTSPKRPQSLAQLAAQSRADRPARKPAEVLAERAAQRHGVFTTADAEACGLTRADVRRMLVQGWWRALHREVHCAASTPVTTEVREAAALAYLGLDAVLSRFSAARHQELDVTDLHGDRVWVDVPYLRGQVTLLGAVISRTRHPVTAAVVDDLAMTPVPRTLLDLGAHLDRGELSRAVSAAVRSKATTVERVLSGCEGLGGRAGIALVRSVCAELDPLLESVLEEEAAPLLRAAGLDDLEQQVDIRLGREFLGRVDFFVRRLGLAIEIDGYAHHSSPDARNRDSRRDRRMLEAGITVVRFTTDDVRRHPERLVAELARLVARLERRAV